MTAEVSKEKLPWAVKVPEPVMVFAEESVRRKERPARSARMSEPDGTKRLPVKVLRAVRVREEGPSLESEPEPERTALRVEGEPLVVMGTGPRRVMPAGRVAVAELRRREAPWVASSVMGRARDEEP